MAINYIVIRTNPEYQYDDVLNIINNNFSSVTTSFLYATGGTIYGDLIVNGSISGVTLYGDGSNLTGISGISGYNYYTTAATLVGQTVFFDRNDQLSAYTLDLSSLTPSGGTDYYVTGATFDKNTSELTLTKNDGGSVIATGITDFYTTGGTLIGTVIYFNRIDQASAYSIELSGLTSGITFSGDYLPLSGGTVTGATTFTGGLNVNTLSATTIYSGNTDLSLLFGNFIGPTASTNNAIVRFSDTTGRHGENSGVFINDDNAISGVTGMDFALDSVDNIIIDGSTNLRGITVGAVRQLHRPSIPGTRAYNFQIDANGFADTKAIEVNYTSSSFSSNDQSSVFNINIDKDNALGGEIDAFKVSSLGTTAVTIHALHAGVQIEPIHQHSGVFLDMDYAFSANSTFTTFEDITSKFVSTTANTTIFSSYQDYVVIGHSEMFSEISFSLNTLASNPGVLPSFEYSTGGTGWATFYPIDNTNGFRQNGNISYEFPPGWSADTVNGVSNKYWIRIRRQKTGNLSIVPIENHVQVAVVESYYWDRYGDILINNLNSVGVIYSGGTNLYDIFSTTNTNNYTTGGTLIGTTVYFDRNDLASAYSIELSGLTSGITFSGNYLPLSGGTVTGAALFDSVSATTLTATTIFSAGTNLLSIFVQPNHTQTITNKRITKRVVSVAASSTPTINTDNGDIFSMTGLSANMTNASTNLTGNPVHGDLISIEITDNGVARTLSWGSSFAASGTLALPTATVISTILRVLFQYNSASSLWVITAVV